VPYSTTYYEPFHVARVFGTMDLMLKSRAAWNIVMSLTERKQPISAATSTWDTTPVTTGQTSSWRWCPKQIGIVNRVFTPDEAEVAYAERVVAAFAEAEAAGSAALQLDGKFIDTRSSTGRMGFGKDGGHSREGRAAVTADPLGGVTVLDLYSYLAGPYCCTLLADLGSTVIKIESPQGDMLRQLPSSLAGESRFFLGTNRGKRTLALDLKQPEGLAVLHRMVETADVLVENFRPSVPARLGIDYPRLKAINPRLIYCGRTDYGDSGPLSEKGGFDQVLQCLSGIAVFQGATAGRP
jgi:CoA-transferase family III